MIKKLLLILTLISGLFAEENFQINYTKHIGLGFIQLDFSSKDFYGKNRDNWVAIYKQGDSNDWNNVLVWQWVKDLKTNIAPGDIEKDTKKYLQIYNLAVGAYALRFFKNNSYTTYDTYNFWVDDLDHDDKVIALNKQSLDNANHTLKITASYKDSKTWIGIYKTGTTPQWENVLNWSWVRNDGSIPDIDLSNYASGSYIVRLFFHNSYHVEKESYFRFSKGDIADKIFDETDFDAEKLKFTAHLKFFPNNPSKKDWIGAFKKGSAHILQNLIAWNYASNEAGFGRVKLITYQKNLITSGDYDLVYFTNNSYTQYGDIGSFSIKYNDPDIQDVTVKASIGNNLLTAIISYKIQPKGKDWLAIFKKGATLTTDNVYQWTYLNVLEDDRNHFTWDILPKLNKQQEYTLVLFKDDSYKVISKTDFKLP